MTPPEKDREKDPETPPDSSATGAPFPPDSARGSRRSPGWLRFVLLGCALIVASSAALCTHRVINPPEPPPDPPSVVEILHPTPSVITALRDLSRLESAEAHVERVVDLRDRQSVFFGLVDADDAILLVAVGDVVAGVDLAELEDDAVEADPEARSVRVRLPAAEIFSARLDSEATYVHTRETDVLAQYSPTLESRARREAERSLRAAALQGGLLQRAEHNAARTLEALIRQLGYERVRVEITERAR